MIPQHSGQLCRVILIYRHRLELDCLANLLQLEPGLNVVYSTTDPQEATMVIREQRPNVVIVDAELPGDGADSILNITRSRTAGLWTIVVSGRPSVAFQNWRDTNMVVIRKESSFTDLLLTVNERLGGAGSCNGVDIRGKAGLSAGSPLFPLTRRQLEVLRYIAAGHSTEEIANYLGISPKTADNHTSVLMKKLRIHSRVSLARLAYREGLLPL